MCCCFAVDSPWEESKQRQNRLLYFLHIPGSCIFCRARISQILMNHPGDHNWHNMRLGQAADVEIYNSASLVGTQTNNHCVLWTTSACR